MPTLKVKMREGRAGVDFSVNPGQIVELDSDLARQWIENGWAELVAEMETTSVEPQTERAVQPAGLPRKRKL